MYKPTAVFIAVKRTIGMIKAHSAGGNKLERGLSSSSTG